MKWSWLLTASVLVSCTTDIPDITPESFACIEDVTDADGAHPCPDSHWCVDGDCVPRLFCNVEGNGEPGCTPQTTRCEPVFSMYSAATRCERGIHTATSALAMGDDCGCADGTHCVAFAEGPPADTFPLYALPNGGALPRGVLGVTGEVEAWRMCLRACSSEANCPGNHTCRPTAVATSPLISDPGSHRFTIGMCFPEQVVTASVAVDPQPSANVCQSRSECSPNPTDKLCLFQVETIADHPTVPIGAAWSNLAIVGRCSSDGANRKESFLGCTTSLECKSGLCVGGRCAQPCNPLAPVTCPNGRCNGRPVSRVGPNQVEVIDTVFICG